MAKAENEVRGVAIFRADAIYSRAELVRMLEGIVSPETFLRRLRIPVRFKNATLGSDILRALQEPPECFLTDDRAESATPPGAETDHPIRATPTVAPRRGPSRDRAPGRGRQRLTVEDVRRPRLDSSPKEA